MQFFQLTERARRQLPPVASMWLRAWTSVLLSLSLGRFWQSVLVAVFSACRQSGAVFNAAMAITSV